MRPSVLPAPKTPTINRPKVEPGSGTVAMLTVLMAIARFGTEVLKTNREILAVSLLTPRNTAELSSAKEDVPSASNVPSRLFALSKAEINVVNVRVSSTFI